MQKVKALTDYQRMQSDKWDILEMDCYKKTLPDRKIDGKHSHYLDFSIAKDPLIREELKRFYRHIILDGIRNIITVQIGFFATKRIMRYLNLNYKRHSILDYSMEELHDGFVNYIYKHSTASVTTMFYGINKYQQPKVYVEKSKLIREIEIIYRYLQEETDPDNRPELEKDVWNITRLPFAVEQRASRPRYQINFMRVHQLELREVFKRFTAIRLQKQRMSVIFEDLKSICVFSDFLQERYPEWKHLKELTRPVIQEYFGWLDRHDWAHNTICSRKSGLKTFLTWIEQYNFPEAPSTMLIFPGDINKRPVHAIRVIPDEVFSQLHQHVGKLPKIFQRMLIVLENIGMRGNELCELSMDCLHQDIEGDYYLQYYQTKTGQITRVPITKDVANTVKEQQEVTAKKYPNSKYLFSKSENKSIAQYSFNTALNKLSYQSNITDKDGNGFRFGMHQFRHTVATRYAREGMSPYMIRSMMGHSSLTSIMPYIELNQSMINQQTREFLAEENRLITSLEKLNKSGDDGIPLSNGYCTKSGDLCDTAMLCYSCGMFQFDDVDKAHLQRYLAAIREKKRNITVSGHCRQAEQLAQLEAALINALEEKHHEGAKDTYPK